MTCVSVCVYVCVYVCARTRRCVYEWVWVGGCMRVCMCVFVRMCVCGGGGVKRRTQTPITDIKLNDHHFQFISSATSLLQVQPIRNSTVLVVNI